MKTFNSLIFFTTLFFLLTACVNSEKKQQRTKEETVELSFESRVISKKAQHWWAHCPVDVTGDGDVDETICNFIYTLFTKTNSNGSIY